MYKRQQHQIHAPITLQPIDINTAQDCLQRVPERVPKFVGKIDPQMSESKPCNLKRTHEASMSQHTEYAAKANTTAIAHVPILPPLPLHGIDCAFPAGLHPEIPCPALICKDTDESIANIFYFGAFTDQHSGIVYNHFTGNFLLMSYNGSVCYLVVYHYKSNTILALPIVRYPLSNYIGIWKEMHLETHAFWKLIANLNFLTSGNAMNSSYI
jgi:hypothetical protein